MRIVILVAAVMSVNIFIAILIGNGSEGGLIVAVTFGLILGCAFFLVAIRNWTTSIYILFIWLVLEDSIRKYTGNSLVLYFAKDTMLLLIYLSYFLTRSANHEQLINWKSPVVAAVAPLAILGILSSVYSANTNWVVPVIGIRMWFIYCPLVLLGIDFAQSDERLELLFQIVVVSAIVVSLLGLVQVIWGNHILNPTNIDYSARLFLEKTGATGLKLTRPTSVFIDAGRFGKYCIMMFSILLGVFSVFRSSEHISQTWRVLSAVALGLVLTMNILSGARTAMLAAPMILVAFMLLFQSCGIGGFGGRFRGGVAGPMLAMILAGGLGFFLYWFRADHLLATLDFAGTTVPYMGQHYNLHAENIRFALDSFFLVGYGIGSASLGLSYFTQLIFEGVETGYASIVIEFGVIGLILWLWIAFGLVGATWNAARILGTTTYLGLPISTVILQIMFMLLLFVLGASIYQDYLVSSHLWLWTGLSVGLGKKALAASQLPLDLVQ